MQRKRVVFTHHTLEERGIAPSFLSDEPTVYNKISSGNVVKKPPYP
ncbi:hypothetical protein HMPREF9374_2278 [Desmospora sp. 8437]|nr:hypothetical protein HMPREF9374_2278 [Desmospora sp. 8437]